MEYLEKLLDEFSDTPRNIILHADILRRGMKLNRDLTEAGQTSCITGISTKLQSLAGDANQPPPSMFHFKADETSVDIKIDLRSPYEIKKEARYYKKCLEAILEQIDPPEEIQIFSQAFDEEDQKDLRELGVTNILFNLEVWDERLWPLLLPGKAEAIGRQEWMNRLIKAVEVFGRGHVGSGFVGGFECAPHPGFLSRDEALKSYLDGFEFLIERGIVPWFTVWTAVPQVGGFQVYDPPPTEFYLRLGQGLHELLDKYGVYPDLGFPRMGVNPPTLGLYCYYCFSMTFSRDYPRLIGRDKSSA